MTGGSSARAVRAIKIAPARGASARTLRAGRNGMLGLRQAADKGKGPPRQKSAHRVAQPRGVVRHALPPKESTHADDSLERKQASSRADGRAARRKRGP